MSNLFCVLLIAFSLHFDLQCRDTSFALRGSGGGGAVKKRAWPCLAVTT